MLKSNVWAWMFLFLLVTLWLLITLVFHVPVVLRHGGTAGIDYLRLFSGEIFLRYVGPSGVGVNRCKRSWLLGIQWSSDVWAVPHAISMTLTHPPSNSLNSGTSMSILKLILFIEKFF